MCTVVIHVLLLTVQFKDVLNKPGFRWRGGITFIQEHFQVPMVPADATKCHRRGLPTFPVGLGNNSAYFSSKTSQGMRPARFTQRLSGFIWSPMGWLKSRKDCCDLSVLLYIFFTPVCSIFIKTARKTGQCPQNPYTYYIL